MEDIQQYNKGNEIEIYPGALQISLTTNKTNKISSFESVLSLDFSMNKNELKTILHAVMTAFNHSTNIYKKGIRKNDNWIASSAIMIDCDNGCTIRETVKKLDDLEINYFIVPSKSHNKMKNGKVEERFHVYIPVTMNDKELYTNAINYFVDLLGGDKAARDYARFFSFSPDIKEDDIIIVNNKKSFVYNIENQVKEPARTPDETKIIDINEKKLKVFLYHVKCLYPQLRFSHYNRSNGTLNFFRNSQDKHPGLFMFQSSRIIHDKARNDNYELQWSLNDFLELENIDKEKTYIKIKKELQNIKDSFKNHSNEPVYIIKTNEGAGKSRAVNEVIEKGDFYTFETKNRMMEELDYIMKKGKEVRIIYSNADIIFNVIYCNRGENEKSEKEAVDVQNDYLKHYEEQKKVTEEEKEKFMKYMSDMMLNIKKASKKLNTLLKKVKNDTNVDITKNGINLLDFLDDEVYHEKISEAERDFIMNEYTDQLYAIIEKHDIFFTTNKKFEILCSTQSSLFNDCLVFQDEFSEDSYCQSKVVETNDKHYPLKIAIAAKLYHADDIFEISKEGEEKIKMLKEKSNVKEWIYAMAFSNRVKNLIEVKDAKWHKEPFNLCIVILTTEKIAIEALPKAKVIEVSQKMLCPKLKIIYVDGLGQTKNEEMALQGRDRILAVKSAISKIFNVEEKYIIGDGIGHSVSNDLFNHKNSRGTNKLKDELLKQDEKKNVGIMLTFPHPQNINKYKGVFFDQIKILSEANDTTVYSYINTETCNEYIMSTLLNDNIHQSLGRVLGFRENENCNEVILVVNIRLKNYLNLNYITPFTFTLTGLLQSKGVREKYKKEFEFLAVTNKLLTMKGPKIDFENKKKSLKEELNFQIIEPFYIKKLIVNILLSVASYIKNIVERKIHNIKFFTFSNTFSFLKRYILANKKTLCNTIENVIDKQGILGILREMGMVIEGRFDKKWRLRMENTILLREKMI